MATPPIVALEIGTTRTIVLVGEADQSHRVRIIGKGVYTTKGVRKGRVVDMQNARYGVEAALKQAADESQVDIGRVIMAIGGGHVETIQNQSAIQILSRDRIVTKEDVEEVTELARAVQLPEGRDVMHSVTQSFSLDGQSGIAKPEGLSGTQLLLNMLLIHAKRDAMQDMRQVALSANLDVDDVVFSGLCAALAVLSPVQKRDGVAVIDLGGGTTDYLAYADSYIAAAGSLAVGGEHVTNDITLAFNIQHRHAEDLKLQHGRAEIDPSVGLRRISSPGAIGNEERAFPLKSFHTVINARVEETLRIIRSRLFEAGVLSKLGSGIIFTGGGAAMPGLCELARRVFGVPCAVGVPSVLGPALEGVPDPYAYATAVGLVQYGIRTYRDTGIMDTIRRIFRR